MLRVEFGEGDGKDAVKSITLTVSMPSHEKGDWSTLTLQLTLDPDGDGASPLKRTAQIKQGFLASVWSAI